jgi:GT2 family glycosyltransferase
MVEPAASAPGAPLDVAVVIPAFNAGRFLDQALASVAGQTRRPAVVVVADDGSEDDTAERARGWRDRLPVEVLSLGRNLGPGPARDRAIRSTGTAMLALLDADDLLLPDHLETMAAASARGPGLVSAKELSWAPGLGLGGPRRRGAPPAGAEAQLAALLRGNYVNFGFFSRALYERAGGFRDFLVGEDWDLWIRMLRTGAPIIEAPHPTAVHRVRAGSLSNDAARTVEYGIEVLTAALAEAGDARERAAARRGLAALRARKRYQEALALAGDGHAWRARLTAARRPADGGARLGAALVALALAPRLSARIERATRSRRVFGKG